MLPVLKALADGEVHHRGALTEAMADYFGLTHEERTKMLPINTPIDAPIDRVYC